MMENTDYITGDTPAERLKNARKAAGFKGAELACIKFGWNLNTYKAHESGRNGFNPDQAKQYARGFGVNAGWLLTGEGVPARSFSLVSSYDPDASGMAFGFEEDPSFGYTEGHWHPSIPGAVPEVDSKLGAGDGTVGEMIQIPAGSGMMSAHKVIAEWLFPGRYLRDEAKVNPDSTVVFEVIGDSMAPSYAPGDRVLVDLSQNVMRSDTVYAISDGYSEPQIKRLQRIPFSNPPEVKIISDNPNLETFTVSLADLTVIGRICGHIARK